MATSLLYLYTESPLHAGTGSTVSAIDLPVQRERITQYPHVYGSGIKGALRDTLYHLPDVSGDEIKIVFGPDTEKASDYAGSVAIGEARLVLFPVRSLTGIFAHATSPFALARLARDLQSAGLQSLPQVPVPSSPDACVVGNAAKNSAGIAASGSVVLEEYTFQPAADAAVDKLANWLIENALPTGDAYAYWRETLPQRLVILPDDAFRDFVLYSTQVVTRVQLNPDTKTVKDGALWTQEAVPSDALFVSTVLSQKVRAPEVNLSGEQVQTWLQEHLPQRIQIGGDETTGHGVVSINWQTK